MDENHIKLQCLSLAHQQGMAAAEVLRDAEKYYLWVKATGRSPVPTLGSESPKMLNVT